MKDQPVFKNHIFVQQGNEIYKEKQSEKKILQAQNMIRKTALSLQKFSDTKLDISPTKCQNKSPLRKLSITQHKELQLGSIISNSQSNNRYSEESSNQNLSSITSNLNLATCTVEQLDNRSKQSSCGQNATQTNDNLSSKCSIKNDIRLPDIIQGTSRLSTENDIMQIDSTNEIERRIHKWLDEQGVRMVSPCNKYQTYFENKKSQILILHKKNFFNSNVMIGSYQKNVENGNQQNNIAVQNSERLISFSHNVSPQKQFMPQIKASFHRYSEQNQNTSECSQLFSNSITDSPLMQRRKIMLQNALERDEARTASMDPSDTKIKNCSMLSINPANTGINKSLAHLSQYKRSNPSKSNNEIASDISADCK